MAVGGVAVDVVADGTGFGASLRAVLARYRNESIDVDVNVRGDNTRFDRAGRQAGQSFSRGFGRELSGVDRQLRSLGSRLGSVMSGVGTAARFGAIAVGIGLIGASALVASANLIAFTAALAPSVGILATLPSVLGVAAAGLATLLVALQGVGDAFSAALGDDVAAFEEALEGIAPAAAETARALREVAPAWSGLREAVQDEFFAGFADQLRGITDVLVGPLTAGMSTAAAALNGFVTGLAEVATSAGGVEFITGSFETLSTVIGNVSGPMADLLASIFAVGNALNEAFGDDAGSGLAGMVQSFADFLQAAADGGGAVEWVNDALTVFRELGAILAPIGGIFASIGSAAEDASGGILGAFGAAVQALDDFLKSAEGVEFLGALFETIGSLGAALGPIFSALGTALTPLAIVAADLITTLAPGIETLISALGEGLAAAAPSLIPLGEALVSIVDAVAPLLPLLGTWLGLLIEVGAFILSALAPALELIVTLFASIYQPQAELWLTVLSELFAVLAPIIGDVSDAVLQLMDPLAELQQVMMDTLLPAIMELLPVFSQLATDVGDQLVGAILELLPPLLDLTTYLIDVYVQMQPLIIAAAQFAAILLGNVATGISTVVGWLVSLFTWFLDVGTAVDNFGRDARIAFDDFVDSVVSGFEEVGRWIESVVSWFTELPGRILGAIGDLGSEIWGAITSGFGDLGEWLGFANGGIITTPTFAALAEDGNPEVVIPLTKPARAQQLAQESGLTQILNVGSSEPRAPANITINVNGGNLAEVRRTIEDVMAEYA